MKENKRFEEAKIKMVMKLKKLTRSAAVEEIARIEAANRERDRMKETEEGCEEERRRRCWAPDNRHRDDEKLMTAEEFFGFA